MFTNTLVTPLADLRAGTVITYNGTVAVLDDHEQWWIAGDMNAWTHDDITQEIERHTSGYKIIHGN